MTSKENGTVGKTVEVRCQWKGEDGTYGTQCSNVRIVKVQDKFQVKYCTEHQAKNRRLIRNAKARDKAAKRREQQLTEA